MNKLLVFALLLMGFSGFAQKSEYKKEQFIYQNDTLPYRILWPHNFDKTKKYPVIFFLHGAGERGSDNEKQLVHGGDLFADSIEKYPAIVIAPQCPKDDYWANVNIVRDSTGHRTFHFHDGGEPTQAMTMAMALLRSFIKEPYTDDSRIYAGGLSMGGMGTFEIVSRMPNTFAAAFPICGGGDPASAEKYAGKVPFWIFHGGKDDIVNPDHSRAMAGAINADGGKARLTIFPNDNHNSWDSAFAEPTLLHWIFSQSK